MKLLGWNGLIQLELLQGRRSHNSIIISGEDLLRWRAGPPSFFLLANLGMAVAATVVAVVVAAAAAKPLCLQAISYFDRHLK